MSLGISTPGKSLSASNQSAASRLGLRIGASLYAGMFLYCALSVLVGPAGLSAYRRLEERKAAMEANLARLVDTRERLGLELESLKSDPDRAALQARGLGYLRRGETAIVLDGRSEEAKTLDAGKVLSYAEPAALSDGALKEISFGAALAVLAFLLAPRPLIGTTASRRRP
jgi:cell division protein FtsB